MTKDEIIEMAKQAGLGFLDERNWMYQDELEAFAKLVAAKEREVMIDMVAFYGGPIDLEDAIRARGEEC